MSVQVLKKCSVELKPVPVVSDGQGRSYDLSPLALDIGNWEVQLSTGDTSKKIYINVCRSLVQMGGPYLCGSRSFPRTLQPHLCVLLPVTGSWACPSSAAACMKVGDEYVSLGHVESSPTLETSVLNLKYTGGQACPRSKGNRTSIIRFKCDKVVSDARLIFKPSVLHLSADF